MTQYGDNKCANCKHNRNCYSQLLGIETYGYGRWECIKDREELEELKTRNKKAIEYMKTLSDEYATNHYDIKNEVFEKLYYEILKGE